MKTCFIIMPFEEKLNAYYSALIKPVVESVGYTVIRADEIYGIQPIIEDITNGIKNADFLIADVTGRNPNVNYELGYAHALNKNVIIISQTMDDVPFDYRHRRAILYNVAEIDWKEKLSEVLKSTIAVIEKKSFSDKVKIRSIARPSPEVSYCTIPSMAIMRYGGMFTKLKARAGAICPYMIDAVTEIVDEINSIELEVDEAIALRGAWFDDKHGNIIFYIDYLYDYRKSPKFNDESIETLFHNGDAYYQHQAISIDSKCIKANFSSDSFFINADEYYSRVVF